MHTYVIHMYMVWSLLLVTNYVQIFKRASEGIAERDDAGHTIDGAFDLHLPIRIKS